MPLKTFITQQDVCDLLNDFLRRDPGTLHALIATRVPCGADLDDSPIQVAPSVSSPFGEIGLLGLLNGLFGTHDGYDETGVQQDGFQGWGAIVMRSDFETAEIKEFVTLESYKAPTAVVLTNGAGGVVEVPLEFKGPPIEGKPEELVEPGHPADL